LLDGQGCPVLRKALLGAYAWEVSASGDTGGAGAVLMRPKKNLYSHIADSLQYGAVKIRNLVEGTVLREAA
jgi:hypothetical protein